LTEFLARAEPALLGRIIQALGEIKGFDPGIALSPYVNSDKPDIRLAALGALVKSHSADAGPAIHRLMLDPSTEIRRSAIVAAGTLRIRWLRDDLLASTGDPDVRADAIGSLARMPDVSALKAYLTGLSGKNPELRATCRKAIEAIRKEALPKIEDELSALPSEAVAELQAIYRRDPDASKSRLFAVAVNVPEPEDYLKFALRNQGDVERGHNIFNDPGGIACIKCHRVSAQGGDVGPDLSTIGSQFDRRALAESILYPSKAVREGYQQIEIETQDDEMIYGLVRTESNEALVIRDANGMTRPITKSRIKSRRNSELSLMPEGLQSGLSLQEFADLVEYLASLRGGR